MNRQPSNMNHLIGAMMKLDPKSREWRNVVHFILSCYACRVMEYDLEAATVSLERLSDGEQRALIEAVLRNDAARSRAA